MKSFDLKQALLLFCILLVIACFINGNPLDKIPIERYFPAPNKQHSQQVQVVNAIAISKTTNFIYLSEQWSEPPVRIKNLQDIVFWVIDGDATELEVHDALDPANSIKFHIGEQFSLNRPMYNFQWRVSGVITRSPVQLRYILTEYAIQ